MKADNNVIKYSGEIPGNPNIPDKLGDYNLDAMNLSSANRSFKQICFGRDKTYVTIPYR